MWALLSSVVLSFCVGYVLSQDQCDSCCRGLQGPAGSQGFPGMRGPIGHKGATGQKGEAGDVLMCKTENKYKPKQIGFMVSRTTAMGPISNPTLVKFDKIITNVGDGFKADTSHFRAPVAGTYHFSVSFIARDTNRHCHIHMFKNGIDVLQTFGTTPGGTGSGSAYLHLEVGDRVWLKMIRNNDAMHPNFNAFTGHLVAED